MGTVEPFGKDAQNTGVPSFHAAVMEEAGKTGPPACQRFPKWLHVIQIQIFSSKTLTPLPLRERPPPNLAQPQFLESAPSAAQQAPPCRCHQVTPSQGLKPTADFFVQPQQ